jgi:hypothetical protein
MIVADKLATTSLGAAAPAQTEIPSICRWPSMRGTWSYSRDHPPETLQVLVALVVTPEGFPSPTVFDDTADVTTRKPRCGSSELMVEESSGSLNSRRLTEPSIRIYWNRQPQCVKSTEPIALHVRPVASVVFRLL